MIATEWAVGRDDGTGWHDVYTRRVGVSRSGDVVERFAVRVVEARVFGGGQAFDVARALSSSREELLRNQTWDDVAPYAAEVARREKRAA